MDEEFVERLREAIPSPHGKAGGVSLAIRELLYVVLDEPIPLQYGEKERDCPIDDLERLTIDLEDRSEIGDEAEVAMERALSLISDYSGDPVAKFRLHAVVGRLHLIRSSAGSL